MPKTVAILTVVAFVALTPRPSFACIVGSDEQQLEEARRYKADQVSLVPPVAKEADQIVLATAKRWLEPNGWESEFLIERVLKGSLSVGARVNFRSSMSNPDLG